MSDPQHTERKTSTGHHAGSGVGRMSEPAAQHASEDLQISDDDAKGRFVATLQNQPVGFAAYEKSADTVVFTHTVVPEALEGRGIGSGLIRHALDDARSRHLTVVPRCRFVAAFIDEHPEYQDLLEQQA